MACTSTIGKSRAGTSSVRVCPPRMSPHSPKAKDISTLGRTTVWYGFRNRNYNHEKSTHHDSFFVDHTAHAVGRRRRVDPTRQAAARSLNSLLGRDGNYRPDR